MNDRDTDLFDEVSLRRALRLDRAEMPPRFDVAAIVARADAERPTPAIASFASAPPAGGAAAGLVAGGAAAAITSGYTNAVASEWRRPRCHGAAIVPACTSTTSEMPWM